MVKDTVGLHVCRKLREIFAKLHNVAANRHFFCTDCHVLFIANIGRVGFFQAAFFLGFYQFLTTNL
ncbi:hypothetical protein, partial [Kingella kingae]|uniref:hypothetical protein n=1 Tax=Kingella kingae TaxID=504 RepID=UPI001E535596